MSTIKHSARYQQIEQLTQSGDNQALYKLAKSVIPGGTQLLSKRPEQFAPDRWPAYYREARGCEIVDLSGRTLIDMTSSGIGACLLGYNHPHVTEAVVKRVQSGSYCTLNTPDEVRLAQRLIDWHPWAEQARFARTGGESMAIAVRIARASTRRDIVAFCGYHGWSDWYLAANLSGEKALDGQLLPGLMPTGLPRQLTGTAYTFAYNQIEQLEKIVSAHGKNLAAVIMEPTRNQHPKDNFLHKVKSLAHECGAVFVIDEISAGFRVAQGGAHMRYGVEPDIAVFAKALGNGHPIGAIIGRAKVMSAAQDSFISSTYWTDGVGPVAALATMDILEQNDAPAHADKIGAMVLDGLTKLAQKHKLPLHTTGHPCLAHVSFDHPQSASLMTYYTVLMLDEGYMACGSLYPSLAHQPKHVEGFLAAADKVFPVLADALAKDQVARRLGTAVKQSGFARLS